MNTFFAEALCDECDPTGIIIDRMRNKRTFFEHVNIFLSKRKTAIMESFFNGGISKWKVPMICMDKDTVGSIFDSSIHSRGERVIIFPSTTSMTWIQTLLDTLQK